MLARPKGWFSSDWLITNDDGEEILLDLSAWREKAEFTLEGRRFELGKEALLGSDFVMRSGDEELARAHKPSVLRNRFELDLGGAAYSLQKVTALGRRFEVRQGDALVGEIAPEGMLTRRTQLRLPPDWPLETRLFLFWLVAVLWNREDQAATS